MSYAQAEAEARARRGEPTTKEAIGSQPKVERESARAPAPTAPEVRALERQAQGGNNQLTLVVAGIAIAGVIGIGIAAASGVFSATPPPTTSTPPPATTATPPPATTPPPTTIGTPPPTTSAPAPPAEVRIRIRAEPADARILIGGIEFPNPMDAPQPRSLTPTRITIEREGHTTIEQLAIFGEDQSFMFQMARGRGVEQRGLTTGGGGGGTTAATMEPSMTTMEVYQGMQGDFREEW
jgi:hypothetical protein